MGCAEVIPVPALDIVIVTPWSRQYVAARGGWQDEPEPTPPITKERTLLMVGNVLADMVTGSWETKPGRASTEEEVRVYISTRRNRDLVKHVKGVSPPIGSLGPLPHRAVC